MPYPYVLLSAAVSLDGYLDDTGPDRLLLSSPADFDRVDEVRASVDAILIGAGTIRADNPRLLVNSPERRAARVADGRPEYPLKVTVTATGDLDPAANFWHTGGEKLVYTTDEGAEPASGALGRTADVVSLGPDLDWRALLEHLHDVRGVRRLMVEGGGTVHTQLLQQGLADELQLVLAPLFVGARRPRACSARGRTRAAGSASPRPAGSRTSSSCATSPPPRHRPGPAAADRHWLRTACELAALCPPSQTAFSVGAVVVAADGTELARGYSREGGDSVVHAEEAALAKIDPADPRLPGATVYSSLEPCTRRASRPAPCAELILRAGVRRVVTAWREPDTFVTAADGTGALLSAGVAAVVLPEYEALAKQPNAHLLP
ncbi:dihydrofolate reductase family protein [Streptomyces diastatochromogenes]|nr:dihydrofolate reductase family protein [Streptomyces diastatochromogenes]